VQAVQREESPHWPIRSRSSLGRFAFKLYAYGNNLDPQAPVTVGPFTPAILGTKQIASFTTASYPGWETALVAAFAFAVVVLGVTLWQLAMHHRPQSASGRAVDDRPRRQK
jgi:hypothetical protein